VPSFYANIRKMVYSLWRLLNVSDNALVRTELCYLFAISPVLEGGVTFFFILFSVLYFVVFYCSTCIITVSWATSLLLN